MAPKLYMVDASPAVRSVLLTAEALGVKLDHVKMNLAPPESDQLKPEFLKMNPQHTVPTLDDDGKVIWDSHAIIVYLAEKYGKDASLYPKDPYTRALINQRLHFDSGVVTSALVAMLGPVFREGATSVPEEKKAAAIEAYEFLEKFLEGHSWVVGDNPTLADLSLISTVTSLAVVVPVGKDKFPNVSAWIERAQNLPYYDANQVGLDNFKTLLLSRLTG